MKTSPLGIQMVGVVLLCFGFVLALSSCSKKPGDSLVGEWSVTGESALVEFRSDGTLTDTEDGKVQTGTYKFTDSSHVEMRMVEDNDANYPVVIPCEVAIKGDTATFTINLPDKRTKTAELKRVK